MAPPKAEIVVDAKTGAIWSAVNDRVPLGVASTIKLVTALIVYGRVPGNDRVPISLRAASMPARKINAKPGQRWGADGLLRAMLIASANDAAVALAEWIAINYRD